MHALPTYESRRDVNTGNHVEDGGVCAGGAMKRGGKGTAVCAATVWTGDVRTCGCSFGCDRGSCPVVDLAASEEVRPTKKRMILFCAAFSIVSHLTG